MNVHSVIVTLDSIKTSVDLYQKAADLDTTNTDVRQRIKNLKEYHKLD
jgi:hypothetical protein